VKVYIAASSREPERVRAAQRMLTELGIELTLDWLTSIEANLALGLRDSDLSIADQRQHANADLLAVEQADVLWLLAPKEPTKGAWIELGYALGHGTPVLVTGDASCIFLTLTDWQLPRDEDARERLALEQGHLAWGQGE
jgi:nucleoside 2-deoxyribosyltransferase